MCDTNVNDYTQRLNLAIAVASGYTLVDLFHPLTVAGVTLPPLPGSPHEWDVTSVYMTGNGFVSDAPGTLANPPGGQWSGIVLANIPISCRFNVPVSGSIFIANGDVSTVSIIVELSRYKRHRDDGKPGGCP